MPDYSYQDESAYPPHVVEYWNTEFLPAAEEILERFWEQHVKKYCVLKYHAVAPFMLPKDIPKILLASDIGFFGIALDWEAPENKIVKVWIGSPEGKTILYRNETNALSGAFALLHMGWIMLDKPAIPPPNPG